MKTKKIISVLYFLPFFFMSGGDLPEHWAISQVLIYFSIVIPNLLLSIYFLNRTFKTK